MSHSDSSRSYVSHTAKVVAGMRAFEFDKGDAALVKDPFAHLLGKTSHKGSFCRVLVVRLLLSATFDLNMDCILLYGSGRGRQDMAAVRVGGTTHVFRRHAGVPHEVY